MKSFFIFLSVVAPLVAATSVHYCEMNCRDFRTQKTIKHIGCNPPSTFDSEKCPSDSTVLEMTPAMKKILVDTHNKKRNLVAGGFVRNHPAACRMATMQWDDKLAKLAAITALQCKSSQDKSDSHDHCHNTNEFKYSGQNIHKVWWSPPRILNYEDKMEEVVESWFEEAKDCNKQIINSFPTQHRGPPIGHFTVMSADRNIRLGCAASTYVISGFRYLFTVCNYATTNMQEHPIYKACRKPAKHCTTGTNPSYEFLCSVDEVYKVNEWF